MRGVWLIICMFGHTFCVYVTKIALCEGMHSFIAVPCYVESKDQL